MSEENPSGASPESAGLPKKETVRITLPPKPADAPVVKRETVRIEPPGAAPKKDSARLPGLGAVPPAPPAAPKPFVPPSAPRPPGAPPAPATRPMMPSPVGGPPRPPGPPARPGAAPMPPAVPAAPKAATYAEGAPVGVKAAAPKKETARISIPPESKPMPKATIRMQQTQPLSQAPVPAIRTTTAPVVAAVAVEEDNMVGYLSWVVLVASIASAVLGYMAYAA